jgi:DNA replication licensing factor MCM4
VRKYLTLHILIHRFDLIYLILDKADEQTDRRLAKHIVSLHFENPNVKHQTPQLCLKFQLLMFYETDAHIRLSYCNTDLSTFIHPIVQLEQLEVLDLQTLVSYISYARKYVYPQLSDEAAEELTRGYVEMRKRGNSPGSRKKVVSVSLCPWSFEW